MEIVKPLSDDEGTERTWFEPAQRPTKQFLKRSDHGNFEGIYRVTSCAGLGLRVFIASRQQQAAKIATAAAQKDAMQRGAMTRLRKRRASMDWAAKKPNLNNTEALC